MLHSAARCGDPRCALRKKSVTVNRSYANVLTGYHLLLLLNNNQAYGIASSASSHGFGARNILDSTQLVAHEAGTVT